MRVKALLTALLAITTSLMLCAPRTLAASSKTPSKWERLNKVVVDLSSQRASLYASDGSLLAVWPVSSGSKAHPTPTGVFRVSSRSRRTFYTPHPWVTMEYMTRFNSNIGFHAIPRDKGKPIWTPLGRYGVSHGCVRLSDSNAAILYRFLPPRATVVVQH